jgi:hypothetical protein
MRLAHSHKGIPSIVRSIKCMQSNKFTKMHVPSTHPTNPHGTHARQVDNPFFFKKKKRICHRGTRGRRKVGTHLTTLPTEKPTRKRM